MNYLSIGIAITAFFSGFAVQGWRMDAVIADMETANAAALTIATSQSLEEATRLQGKKENALRFAQAQSRKNAVAADAARIELNRMRVEADRAATAIPTATCTSVRNYAATATTVFGECSVALEDMARKADGHALDSKALMSAWPDNKEKK